MIHGSDNPSFDETEIAQESNFIPIFLRLLRTIRHRKKVVLSTLYVFCLAGAAYYALSTRYFESAAKLLIVEQKQDQLSSVSDHDNSGNTMTTHRELVKSPVVIQNAIQNLSPEHRIDLQGISPRKWVDAIAKRLNARVTRKTNIIDVSYRSRHPEAAAAVVRAVIHSYLQFVDQTHKGSAGDFVEVLKTGYSERQDELDAKQQELQLFRKEIGHLAIAPDSRGVQPMVQRVANLNDAWTEAQIQRLEIQATEASVKQGLEQGEDINQHLMSIESTLGKQMLLASMGLSSQDLQLLTEQQKKLFTAQEKLQQLSSSYGPKHPHIAELKKQVVGLEQFLANYRSGAGQRFSAMGDVLSAPAVLNMLQRSVREATQKENRIFKALEEARTEATQQSDHVVQLQIMEHDVARLESHLDTLSEKIDTFDISQVHAPIRATVVREPLPNEMAVSPQLRKVVVFCFLGGLIAGCLIVYVQDILDDRFNTPEELSTQLGVPVLAIIRQLDPLEGEGMDTVHTSKMPNATETEAFRTLRTALTLGTEVSERILVSSSEPGDGKTTVAVNLAVAFANAGKRTLIIDADLRRPGLTAMLAKKGIGGVADILIGDRPVSETAAEFLHSNEVAGLDVLSAGIRCPNPAELLSGPRFAELLAWADAHYDQIVVDCPPVLAVSDAQIVGRLVDGAILVVRPDKNHRRVVMRAVDSFQATGCHLLGVVANGISSGEEGYGYGYGYGYEYGYGHDEDGGDEISMPSIAPPASPVVPIEMPSVAGPPAPPIRPRKAA